MLINTGTVVDVGLGDDAHHHQLLQQQQPVRRSKKTQMKQSIRGPENYRRAGTAYDTVKKTIANNVCWKLHDRRQHNPYTRRQEDFDV
jgi:hypothetical protein